MKKLILIISLLAVVAFASVPLLAKSAPGHVTSHSWCDECHGV